MSNEKTNVIQLFKSKTNNVVEFTPRIHEEPTESKPTFKKVSGGYDYSQSSMIREGFDSVLISKSGIFGGNTHLFMLTRDGEFKKLSDTPFKDKIAALKYAYSNFDTEKVDFNLIVK